MVTSTGISPRGSPVKRASAVMRPPERVRVPSPFNAEDGRTQPRLCQLLIPRDAEEKGGQHEGQFMLGRGNSQPPRHRNGMVGRHRQKSASADRSRSPRRLLHRRRTSVSQKPLLRRTVRLRGFCYASNGFDSRRRHKRVRSSKQAPS